MKKQYLGRDCEDFSSYERVAGIENRIVQIHEIRRRVRIASGRSDGRCGKVAEAIESELGWAYRWGHLLLLNGEVCWIHCWNQLPDGTIVDATTDQFEERWLGDLTVLPPDNALYSHYNATPPGHRFHITWDDYQCCLFVYPLAANQIDEASDHQLAVEPNTNQGWMKLGAAAIQFHSGWQLPDWVNQEAGMFFHEAAVAGQPVTSRDLEFHLDAFTLKRRIANHGKWTSPEWRECQNPPK